jgi:hypothetical protein
MNWKEFLKPDPRKIAIFIILCLMMFVLTLFVIPSYCYGVVYEDLIHKEELICKYLFFETLDSHIYRILWMNVIVTIILTYLLSCFIIWIYSKPRGRLLKKRWYKIILIIILILFFYPKECGNWGTSIEATYTKCSCLGIGSEQSLLSFFWGYTLGGGKNYCYGVCLKNTCECYRYDPRNLSRGLIPCKELEYPEITARFCDATTPCPEGLKCISFPHLREPRCAQPNPCSYYRCPVGTKCIVGETYPFQVICTP